MHAVIGVMLRNLLNIHMTGFNCVQLFVQILLADSKPYNTRLVDVAIVETETLAGGRQD
jgi:hypothetical protein